MMPLTFVFELGVALAFCAVVGTSKAAINNTRELDIDSLFIRSSYSPLPG
jgi:hypothetical protein